MAGLQVVYDLLREFSAFAWELVGGLEAAAGAVPASVHQGIMQQVERCAPEVQAVLEAASVAGTEFAAAAVAAGMAQAVDVVEACCDACVRREQFLQALAPTDWPDGTVTTRYRFRHDLYREVLYARVPVSRRVQWHRQIGGRLETGYGPQAREIAAELAEHFVRGRDTERAVQYLQYAGEQAVQRSAYQEALQHLTRGLALLTTLPETPARAEQDLDVQLALGPALIATKGFAAYDWVAQDALRGVIVHRNFGTLHKDGEPVPMVVQAAQDLVLGQVEVVFLQMRLGALSHLAQFGCQVALALGKGRRLLIKWQPLIPLPKPGRIEAVELADIIDPREHPCLEFRPTASRPEKIAPHMRPTKGQNQVVMVLGQAFVGAVAVTHQHHLYQVPSQLGNMRFGHVGPSSRGHAVEHH